MRSATLFVCTLIAAGQPVKVDPIEAQVRRIEALASAEPPIFGIDTRLRTVDMLTTRRPARARQVLDRTIAGLGGVHHQLSYAKLLLACIRRMALFDADEAEKLVQRLPRNIDPKQDFAAEAYDAIIAAHPGDAPVLIDRGLAAGAFAMGRAHKRLTDLVKSDSGAAAALFTEMLASVPDPAGDLSVQYLAEVSRVILPAQQGLGLEGLERAMRAGWTGDRAFADELRRVSPELYEQYSKQLAPRPVEEKATERKRETDIFEVRDGEAGNLPFSSALTAARGQTDQRFRVGDLIRLSRREDLSPQQQNAVAAEALSAAAKLDPADPNRLFAFSMLARDLAKLGDRAHAARAATLLAESFSAACHCEDSGCDSLEGREDCSDILNDFVDYLEEEHLTPEDLAIRNVSVDARIAVRELSRLLGLPKKKGLFDFKG